MLDGLWQGRAAPPPTPPPPPLYMPYEGPSLPNQNSKKLGVFGRKLRGATTHCIVIFINIRENTIIMFKACLIHLYEIHRYKDYNR